MYVIIDTTKQAPLNPQTLQITCLNKDVVPLQTTFFFFLIFSFEQAFTSRQSPVSMWEGWQSHVTQQSEPRYWHKADGVPVSLPGNRQGTISQSVGKSLLSFSLLLSLEGKRFVVMMITRTRKVIPTYDCVASHRLLYQSFQRRRRVGGGIMRRELTGGRWFACHFFLFFFFSFFFSGVLCVCVRSVAFPVSVHVARPSIDSLFNTDTYQIYLLGPDPTTGAKEISKIGPCVFVYREWLGEIEGR